MEVVQDAGSSWDVHQGAGWHQPGEVQLYELQSHTEEIDQKLLLFPWGLVEMEVLPSEWIDEWVLQLFHMHNLKANTTLINTQRQVTKNQVPEGSKRQTFSNYNKRLKSTKKDRCCLSYCRWMSQNLRWAWNKAYSINIPHLNLISKHTARDINIWNSWERAIEISILKLRIRMSQIL